MVSRRKPISDVLRRPRSGDSPGPDDTDAAVGGHPSPLAAAFGFFDDPVDLKLAVVQAFGSATLAAVPVPDAAVPFGSDGNL
jgi:hypothetical protein